MELKSLAHGNETAKSVSLGSFWPRLSLLFKNFTDDMEIRSRANE